MSTHNCNIISEAPVKYKESLNHIHTAIISQYLKFQKKQQSHNTTPYNNFFYLNLLQKIFTAFKNFYYFSMCPVLHICNFNNMRDV